MDHARPSASDEPQLDPVQGARLIGIGIDPPFAIGQRALFLRRRRRTSCGTALPDQAVVEAIKAMGGISAIAISHPHYYSSMESSRAFGGVPIYLHAADQQWVMRPDKAIVFWEDETKVLAEGLTLVRCGGHFEGGTVLHWAGGAEGSAAVRTTNGGDMRQPRSLAMSSFLRYTAR